MGSRKKPGDPGFRAESFNQAIHSTPQGKQVTQQFAESRGLKTDSKGVVSGGVKTTPKSLAKPQVISADLTKDGLLKEGLVNFPPKEEIPADTGFFKFLELKRFIPNQTPQGQVSFPPKTNTPDSFFATGNKFLDFGTKLDIALGGIIPGGPTPKEVNINTLTKRLDNTRTQNTLQEAILQEDEESGIRKDLISVSFLEKLGFGRTEDEIQVQELLREQQRFEQLQRQLPKTIEAQNQFSGLVSGTEGAQQLLDRTRDATDETFLQKLNPFDGENVSQGVALLVLAGVGLFLATKIK